jgi:hypothetical protein
LALQRAQPLGYDQCCSSKPSNSTFTKWHAESSI